MLCTAVNRTSEDRMTRRFGRFLRRNTIALLALFVALSGTAFAASTLAKNSVGTKQLKNNAVISSKIKNNQVTGADVKESSLGKVPSAATADTATNVAKTFHTGTIKASVGQTVPVLTYGPFTLVMRCNDLGSNNYQMQVIIASTEDHSAAASTGSGPGDFGPATPEATRTISTFASTTAIYLGPYSIDFVAAAPSGARIDAIAAGGIHTLGAACAISVDGWTN